MRLMPAAVQVKHYGKKHATRDGFRDENGVIYLPPLKNVESWKKKMADQGFQF